MASILKLDTLQTPSGTGNITSPNKIIYPGAVLQTVYTSYSTQQSGSGSGTVLTFPGLTTSITPTVNTSKVLIDLCLSSYLNGNVAGFGLRVYRNGTAIYSTASNYEVYQQASTGVMGDNYGRQSWTLYDSPATTSQVTYTFGAVIYGSGIAGINYGNFYTSMVTLMEMAQ